jgi:hypothetical protein
MKRYEIPPLLLMLFGIGIIFLVILIVGYKILLWLHEGYYRFTDIRTVWLWGGLKVPITGELGLDKILSWIFDQSIEFGLFMSGVAAFLISILWANAMERRTARLKR